MAAWRTLRCWLLRQICALVLTELDSRLRPHTGATTVGLCYLVASTDPMLAGTQARAAFGILRTDNAATSTCRETKRPLDAQASGVTMRSHA